MAHRVCVSTAFSEAQTELDGGCIRELLRIACGQTFAWDVPWQGPKDAAEKFGTGQDRQGLKPILFWFFYGPTKVVP